jgi:hypothetical protein
MKRQHQQQRQMQTQVEAVSILPTRNPPSVSKQQTGNLFRHVCCCSSGAARLALQRLLHGRSQQCYGSSMVATYCTVHLQSGA